MNSGTLMRQKPSSSDTQNRLSVDVIFDTTLTISPEGASEAGHR